MLIGYDGGDVETILWKKGNKYVSIDKPEGRGKGVFPIRSLGKTPFVDIEVISEKDIERLKNRR